MTHIHDEKVNNIAKCNLKHDIINHPKLTKQLNSHYSSIRHGFMNTIKGRAKLNIFLMLLGSGCNSKIVMGTMVLKNNS